MEKRVLNQKLDNLRNCTLRIEGKLPLTDNELSINFDVQDIISVNLERSVQSCIDIASHISSDFDDVSGLSAGNLFLELIAKKVLSQETALGMVKAVGFRNLLVHRYAAIDWASVQQGLLKNLGLFRQFAGEVARFCNL